MANALAHDFEHDQPSARIAGLSPASRTMEQLNAQNAKAAGVQPSFARKPRKYDSIKNAQNNARGAVAPKEISFAVAGLSAKTENYGRKTEVSMSGADLRARGALRSLGTGLDYQPQENTRVGVQSGHLNGTVTLVPTPDAQKKLTQETPKQDMQRKPSQSARANARTASLARRPRGCNARIKWELTSRAPRVLRVCSNSLENSARH